MSGSSEAAVSNPRAARRRRAAPIVRAVLGLLLVIVTAWVLGPAEIAARLAGAQPQWVALGVALVIPQLLLLALRWQLTASALGAHLGYAMASREYAVSLFLNQVLPLGVLGDVQRAWRHGRALGRGHAESSVGLTIAVHAAVIDRLSGQLVVLLAALCAWPAWLAWPRSGPAAPRPLLYVALFLGLAALVAASWRPLRQLARTRWGQSASAFLGSVRAALLSPRILPVQLVLSAAVALSIAAQFACAARALGLPLSWLLLLRIVPALLVALAVPLTAAGWGLREAATAVLYGAAGLAPAQGVAVSLLFGVIGLLSSMLALGSLVVVRSR